MPPVISCPSGITKQTPVGQNSTLVFWSYTELSDDARAVARLLCDPEWGSEFQLGVTTVTCTAIDDEDSEAACQFPVTVNCEYRIHGLL